MTPRTTVIDLKLKKFLKNNQKCNLISKSTPNAFLMQLMSY